MEGTIMMQNREFHHVANIFPMMDTEEFAGLKSDIEVNGLLEPICVNADGHIIDGRNRYLACEQLGITPEYRTFDGNGSLVAFVVSLNLKRRHLNQLQKSIIAIDIEKQLAVEAHQRQREAGKQFGRGQTKKEDGTYLFEPEEKLVEKIQQPIKLKVMDNKSSQQAAKIVGTNQHYVSDAKRLAATAPDVIEAAMAGKITTMPDALKIAKLPEMERRNIFKKIDSGLKPSTAINENANEAYRAKLNAIEAIRAKGIEGVYDTIVMDPPWNVKWRTSYPKMSVDEIREEKPPCSDDCHVFVWTIQEFLPITFELIKEWGLEYVCTFVWLV